MASKGRNRRLSATTRNLRKGGVVHGSLAFWDFSKNPTDNSDWDKKLGHGDATRGVAIAGYDEDAKKSEIADGVKGQASKTEKGIPTGRLMDPNSFVLRVYDKDGKDDQGADRSLWQPRLVVDHDHENSKKENRASQVIDSCDKQKWGWLSDVLRVTGRQAENDDKELTIDDAGFLTMARKKSASAGKRNAIALDISGNKSFVSDGKHVMQLSHILDKVSLTNAVAEQIGTTGGPGSTVVSPSTPGQTQADGDDDCDSRASDEYELCLREDTAFNFLDGVARIEPRKPLAPPTDVPAGDIRKVHLYVDKSELAGVVPGPKLSKDGKSNHEAINKAIRFPLRGWVVIESDSSSETPEHYDYSYHSPPPEDQGNSTTGASTGGTPTPGTSGENPDGTATGDPVASTDTSKETSQVDHGFSKPQSPGMSQKYNSFPHKAGSNPTAIILRRKGAGKRNIQIRVLGRPSRTIGAGKVIEMNILVGQWINDAPPEDFYVQRFDMDENTPINTLTKWTKTFKGLDARQGNLTIIVERRNDTSSTNDTAAEGWISQTKMIPIS